MQRIPSPQKFRKTECRESDYESDFELKIQPIWYPRDAEGHKPQYKPIKPIFTPTGRISNVSSERSPIPPTEFERTLKFEGAARPKFEPINKYKMTTRLEQSCKSEDTREYQVHKPKPVSAKTYLPQPKPTQAKSTQYYTAIAGPPYHNKNAVATELCNRMEMQEHTESCHRVINMSSTKRFIEFDKQQKQHHHTTFDEQLEPFPFKAATVHSYAERPKLPPPPTPTKFIPAEFRESDYDSEIEAARIRPLWTPNPSDSDEPHFRSVKAPMPNRSVSVPRNYERYERILTPMDFDHAMPEMPSKIHRTPSSSPQYYDGTTSSSTTAAYDQYKTQTLDRYVTKKKSNAWKKTQDDIDVAPAAAHYGYQPNERNYVTQQYDYLRNQFKDSSRQTEQPIKPILKRAQSVSDSPQAYRDESRVSQYGMYFIFIHKQKIFLVSVP